MRFGRYLIGIVGLTILMALIRFVFIFDAVNAKVFWLTLILELILLIVSYLMIYIGWFWKKK